MFLKASSTPGSLLPLRDPVTNKVYLTGPLCFLLKKYHIVLISYMNTMNLDRIYPLLSLCNLQITSPIPFATSSQGLLAPSSLSSPVLPPSS